MDAIANALSSPLASAFFNALVAAIPKLFELFQHTGRDGFLTALDASLAAARSKTDSDLTAKHRPPTAAPNPSEPTPPDHGAPR